MKHSIQAKIDAGLINEWPRGQPTLNNKRGNKLKDTGKLPLEVKVIPKWVCDPNHRKKVFRKKMYAVGSPAKKVDVLRMDKYIGYFLRQNKGCTDFESFKRNAKAPLEHLFDCHIYYCKEFCPVLAYPTENFNGKYRSKVEHKELYTWEPFMMNSLLMKDY